MTIKELRDILGKLEELGLGDSSLKNIPTPEIGMSFCAFQGSPPAKYKTWGDFISSPMKEGVFVRTLKKSDIKK